MGVFESKLYTSNGRDNNNQNTYTLYIVLCLFPQRLILFSSKGKHVIEYVTNKTD